MLAAMRPSQLGEWLALYAVDPWGEQRADLRAGIVASTLANVHRDARQRPEPFSPQEFMPYVERPKSAMVQKFKAFLKNASTAKRKGK